MSEQQTKKGRYIKVAPWFLAAADEAAKRRGKDGFQALAMELMRDAVASGQEVPAMPRRAVYLGYMTDDEFQAVQEVAARSGLKSMSGLVLALVSAWLEQEYAGED